MVASMPIFMAVIELALPGSIRIGRKGWIGLLLGFAGVVLLVTTGSGTGAMNVPGALMLIGGTLSWSLGSVYSKQFKSTGSIVTQIGIQMTSGGTVLTLIGLVLGEAFKVSLSPKGIGAILYLAIFGSILAYSCYMYILAKWPLQGRNLCLRQPSCGNISRIYSFKGANIYRCGYLYWNYPIRGIFSSNI